MSTPAIEVTPSVPPAIVIRPARGWAALNLKELWRYRELIYFLVWRDVKVRYKQTLLGAAWAILKPFFSMVVFYLVFDRLAGLSTDGVPGPIFYFSGLLPWVYFQDGVSKAAGSLVAGSNLITKIYFPRLAIPLSPILAGLADFGLSFLVMIGMVFFYRLQPGQHLWALPLFLLLALVTALGAGLWLSALNVTYRDVGYVTPFMLQAWLYLSPVAYPVSLIPEGPWRMVYALNPMAGVIQGFRWALLGVGSAPTPFLAVSVSVSLLLLISGAFVFRRMEREFADVV
ncbi:MAG TPA: ABC transporter permease [Anaerolineales bacterium]|nr:ABC transporter permease [Anaerolineales bacterium]